MDSTRLQVTGAFISKEKSVRNPFDFMQAKRALKAAVHIQ